MWYKDYFCSLKTSKAAQMPQNQIYREIMRRVKDEKGGTGHDKQKQNTPILC